MMFQNAAEFKAYVRGKKIDVLGIGVSHTPLAAFLLENGARVTARDKRPETEIGAAADLRKRGAKLILGETYLQNLGGELIFRTPGMRPDLPELEAARENGAVIISEMEVFFQICPATLFAVTGSDGKTTTATLIAEILKEAGRRVHLGGNIGAPLLPRIDEIREGDAVVAELSSFQLFTMRQCPNVAVVTNLSPNHLDWHTSMDEYADAKRNIFRNQTAADALVYNADVAYTAAFSKEGLSKKTGFSSKGEAEIRLRENAICAYGERVLPLSDIKIPGAHNVENFMAAVGAVYPEHAGKAAITRVAKTFGGVAHRIEFVREAGGVSYYNSSIDSSPNRTMNTLKVFPEKVILIAGGKDKGIPYDEIGAPVLKHVKELVLIGKTSGKIAEAVEKAGAQSGGAVPPTPWAASFENAVEIAAGLAKAGDVVLLSPASTSFDLFKNFEERGNLFKELVTRL
jgi:UDP-N-acetylmuramoylalanine--D-glutamate ligase